MEENAVLVHMGFVASACAGVCVWAHAYAYVCI